jgi:hypothetical protein
MGFAIADRVIEKDSIMDISQPAFAVPLEDLVDAPADHECPAAVLDHFGEERHVVESP